jgi:glycerol-3-phosphate dehydrogenase
MAAEDTQVVVIGGGVVGCAVLHALARGGAEAMLLEAEAELALGASGSNSGILHTGFDSPPGQLETRLILRSAELREQLLEELGVPVRRCGALLEPSGAEQREAVARLSRNAAANGVEAHLRADGSLSIPGEAVTDPVAFVGALATAAHVGGAAVRLGVRVTGFARGDAVAIELADGETLRARAAVNCAGLYADELARLAGDELPAIYPRKGEFLVFEPPPGEMLDEILLPVPSALGKGVLVFPTLDGRVIAGPTAREREDKRDWSVERDAADLIMPRAMRAYPPLEGAAPIAAYAGLRPAGRDANYVIERSRALPRLIHVAAIRSTGLSASLAIGEHVAAMLAQDGAVELGRTRRLAVPAPSPPAQPWWLRAARRSDSPTRG